MSASTNQTPIIDHIVILVSHTTLLTLRDTLKDTFTVIIGGSHADGLTSNNLILFKDGSYIELIAFFDDIDPDRRATHRWGRRPENTIIDWAYTLPQDADFTTVQGNVSEAQGIYVYEDPVPGGRKRPDGEVLKWAVAAAREKDKGTRVDAGKLPFWCLDQTPRELRVPYQGNPQTEHPSGALGVSRATVRVPPEEVAELSKVYDGIHGNAATGKHSWSFKAHSGLDAGVHHHRISLAEVVNHGPDLTIELVLLGSEESPKAVEILPGLHIRLET